MKSTFVTGLDVEHLIDDVLAHPLVKQKHRTNQTNAGTWANFQK